MECEFGKLCPKDWKPPEGCKHFPLYTHYELKHDLRKKCRLVAGRNRLDASRHNTSSSIVKNSSVKSTLLIATANDLKVEGGDVENACLNAKCGEKACTIASPEFGEKAGMKMLIQKAFCGLKTPGVKFWELLVDALRKMGLAPTRHGNNVWIKPREDGHDFIATHVEDFIVVAKDSKKCADQIKQAFNLRSEGKIDYFLGHGTRCKKNGLWETFPKTSTHKAIAKVEQAMGGATAASGPVIINEDDSTPLNDLGLHHHQMTT